MFYPVKVINLYKTNTFIVVNVFYCCGIGEENIDNANGGDHDKRLL